jgi:hypothetical protein
MGRSVSRVGALIVAALACAVATSPAHAQVTETVLHHFTGSPDGAQPNAPLLAGAFGVLYGTTTSGGSGTSFRCFAGLSGCGVVFSLTPPASPGHTWTETILHNFSGGRDGAAPSSGLIADAAGVLYGTTFAGGSLGRGTAFKLAPPAKAGAAWTETVIHSFRAGSDGFSPGGNLIADASGALYGTTPLGGTGNNCNLGCGTVFKLTPPASVGDAWTESVLYSFHGGSDGDFPTGPLLIDAAGALYGTTVAGGGSSNCTNPVGCGIVFKLHPPATSGAGWTERVLHRFQGGTDGAGPQGGLVAKAGILYGTTGAGGSPDCTFFGNVAGCGTVFKLHPPSTSGGAWVESVIYRFKGQTVGDGAAPVTPLALRSGAFYGTTAGGGGVSSQNCTGGGCGTVFKLSPPVTSGGPWIETVLYSFKGGSDGSFPTAGLISGKRGAFYGSTEEEGSCPIDFYPNCGTVFAIVP